MLPEDYKAQSLEYTRQHAYTLCVGSLSHSDLIFFVAEYNPAPYRQNP